MLAKFDFLYIPILVDKGADIINFSWIFDGFSPYLREQIIYALQHGVICVAGAGNDQSNIQAVGLSIPAVVYPAGYNFGSLGQVIAVSATEMYNSTERFIPYYNYSPGTDLSSTGFIDFAAPGSNYRSLSWNSVSGTQHIWEGTSVAAPFVSALVALMLSVNSTLTVNQVYDILRRTTDRIGQFTYDSNGWNRYLGYGRIDAANAVYVAAGQPAKPRGMYLSWSNNHPKINWEAGEETDLNHYEIYKKKGTSNYSYYASTTNTYYIDYSEYKYSSGNQKIYVNYYVKTVDNQNDKSLPSDEINAAVNNSIEKNALDENYDEDIPIEYSLNQNYPNPFNPTTTIEYTIPTVGQDGILTSHVTIIVYDALGRELQKLVNEQKQPGRYTVQFEGSNLTSGVYFVKMQSNDFTATKKIVLAK